MISISHFTTVKTEVRDAPTLLRAMQALGCTVERDARVRGYMGDTTKAAVVVRLPGGYDVGFVLNADGTYAAVADFTMSREAAVIVQRIVQRYAAERLRGAAAARGYRVVGEQTDAQGNIRLMLEV